MKTSTPTAIDLYSGVGGWSAGLKMAGIHIVASYDKWRPANETNSKNNDHPTFTVDLRNLSLSQLPKNVDYVVGSPPCTQFSYANRGGGGNIEEGLKDIKVFLRIVDHVRPKAWAMENVPRVAPILDRELKEGGCLAEFAHLGVRYQIINMEDFGLPQRRKRCIAGNFDFALLQSYTRGLRPRTLGDVCISLGQKVVTDPLFNITLPKEEVVDHDIEEGLSYEEERINRANKIHHPVYNKMPFPDSMERSVRTITATCTRVSRESIIIKDVHQPHILRRLTVRERASSQGFPITFQFYGRSHSQKLKMVGNAIPPLFTYYLAHALQSSALDAVPPIQARATHPNPAIEIPTYTPPARPGSVFGARRTFRFAIPSMRLSSGVRFDLTNASEADAISWHVEFVFGTSKSIHKLNLDTNLFKLLMHRLDEIPSALTEIEKVGEMIESFDTKNMQRVWCHSGSGAHHPFQLLDALDGAGESLSEIFASKRSTSQAMVLSAIRHQHEDKIVELKGIEKLIRNAPVIAAGLLIGSLVNSYEPAYPLQGAAARSKMDNAQFANVARSPHH